MYIQKRKSSFFWLLIFGWMVVFQTFSLAATLHVIIVSDTDDSSIGASVQIDQRRLQGLVKSISEHTGLTLSPHYLSGNQLSRANVEQAINSVSVGSDDVIFFFWNGHGFNDGKSVLPTMYLGNWQNTFGLSEVVSKLGQKSPRLLIVIGDTCNKPMGGHKEEGTMRSEKPENYKELFLKYQGTVLASSSMKDQYSFGNNQTGGLYTSAFLSSLSKELASGSTPSWKTLMDRANAPINVGSGVIQNPQSNINVTYGGTTGGHDDCKVVDETTGRQQSCGAPPGPKENDGTCVPNTYRDKDKVNDKDKVQQQCCKTDSGREKCWPKVW